MHKKPKYMAIIDHFKSQIVNEELKKDDQLPSESQICEQFGVSHMTVNKAMSDLLTNGYVRRTPGRGTFVSTDYKTHLTKSLLKSASLTELIRTSGVEPRTELVKYSIVKGREYPEIAAAMHVGENQFLHYFIRSRYGNGKLLALSYTFVSQAVIPSLDITKLEGSFNEYVDHLGIVRSYGHTEFCATLPTAEQAELIGNAHIPLLKNTIIWNVDDTPFELTMHFFIGDRYSVTQDLALIVNDDGSFSKSIL